jgi:hypothetical protein
VHFPLVGVHPAAWGAGADRADQHANLDVLAQIDSGINNKSKLALAVEAKESWDWPFIACIHVPMCSICQMYWDDDVCSEVHSLK